MRDRMLNQMDGHGRTILSIPMRSARFAGIALAVAAITGLLVLSIRGQAGTPISLLVYGGTVVTMDVNGRVIPDRRNPS